MEGALPDEELEWDKANLTVNESSIGPQPQIDKESVKKVLNETKKGKASGTSGAVSEMLLASGDLGIEQMTNLFCKIIAENKVPEDWNTRVIVNCFNNKVRQLNEEII